jgi:hypothetical protein
VKNNIKRLMALLSTPVMTLAYDSPRPESIVIGDQEYSPIDIPGIHGLALDPYLFDRIKTDWALYPDHLVFLGHSPTCFDTVQSLKKYLSGNITPALIFLKGRGVFAKPGFSSAKLAQLKCYYDVIVRQPQHTRLKSLNEQQIAELLNWDAEHYRQQNAKNLK